MQALANSWEFWISVLAALVALYLLPTLIGMVRGVERLSLVFLVNLIAAPTGLGWLAALILAFGPRRLPPEPVWPLQQGTPWPAQPGAAYPLPQPRVPDPRYFGSR